MDKMNKNQGIILSLLISFILGYGYGVIDALSEFNKIQVGLSIFAVIIFLIFFFLIKTNDAVEKDSDYTTDEKVKKNG